MHSLIRALRGNGQVRGIFIIPFHIFQRIQFNFSTAKIEIKQVCIVVVAIAIAIAVGCCSFFFSTHSIQFFALVDGFGVKTIGEWWWQPIVRPEKGRENIIKNRTTKRRNVKSRLDAAQPSRF